MKIINKILNAIIVLYFLSLFLLLIGCLFFQPYAPMIFNIFIKALLLFRFILAIILVAFVLDISNLINKKRFLRREHKTKEVNF